MVVHIIGLIGFLSICLQVNLKRKKQKETEIWKKNLDIAMNENKKTQNDFLQQFHEFYYQKCVTPEIMSRNEEAHIS